MIESVIKASNHFQVDSQTKAFLRKFWSVRQNKLVLEKICSSPWQWNTPPSLLIRSIESMLNVTFYSSFPPSDIITTTFFSAFLLSCEVAADAELDFLSAFAINSRSLLAASPSMQLPSCWLLGRTDQLGGAQALYCVMIGAGIFVKSQSPTMYESILSYSSKNLNV